MRYKDPPKGVLYTEYISDIITREVSLCVLSLYKEKVPLERRL